jgi:hypothetical protein
MKALKGSDSEFTSLCNGKERHSETCENAACRGWFKSRVERIKVMMSIVKGACLGRFEAGRARCLAPSKANIISPCCANQG